MPSVAVYQHQLIERRERKKERSLRISKIDRLDEWRRRRRGLESKVVRVALEKQVRNPFFVSSLSSPLSFSFLFKKRSASDRIIRCRNGRSVCDLWPLSLPPSAFLFLLLLVFFVSIRFDVRAPCSVNWSLPLAIHCVLPCAIRCCSRRTVSPPSSAVEE